MGGRDGLEDLRIGDLVTFLSVARTASITAAGRELRVTASQVSKAIARIENHLRTALFVRSRRGVNLTDAARAMVPHVEAIVRQVRTMNRGVPKAVVPLAIAAPSYLMTSLVPAIAAGTPGVRVCGVELPPAQIRAHVADSDFDLALLPGAPHGIPPSWTAEVIGVLRKGLFASPALARRLGRSPLPVEELSNTPFVSPFTTVQGPFASLSDDCPLAPSERTTGHQAQTIGSALELAARTDQLVFGPVVAARAHLDRGALVEVPVRGWDVREPLQMISNGTSVLARVHADARRSAQGCLAQLDPGR
jgi:DNA-binding transcriptional LysR family regulator